MVDLLVYSSVVLFGLVLGVVCIKFLKSRDKNTISEEHIRKCICFDSDNAKSIDDVVENVRSFIE